jgi:transposase
MAKQRIPNGKYTKEFREEAVKLITEGGLSIPEVGRRLSLAPSTMTYWVKAHKTVKLVKIGKIQKALTEVEMENYRLRGELAEVKMERDIFKKAAAYFAKESLPGTRS